jgi:FAD/FMN-containing dehydrogenase
MNKVAHYLQEHLIGEVVTSDDARKFFSTDGSIFQVEPAIIAYPRNENDVRKTARFVWQLAERGRLVPLIARGLGSNTTGSAIGSGIVMVFPAHLNKILELDTKSGSVAVEPGVSIDKLQQALHTHGRFLPTIPVNYHYSSIGGALGKNSAGEHSIKYSSIKNYVKKARVVLSNGEVIETRRLNKREFSKKMGLSTFEGEIYRAMDALMEENHNIIKNFKLNVAKNSAGYDIFSVRRKDKSFDLTPLIVGSEGTLGIVTEAELDTEPYNPKTTVITAKIDDINKCGDILSSIRSLKDLPSTVDIIDKGIINFIAKTNPNQIKGIFTTPYPAVYMIIEFDDASDRKQSKAAHKVKKILEKHDVNFSVENDEDKKLVARKVRELVSAFVGYQEGSKQALPIVNDAVVPPEQFMELIKGIYDICKNYQLTPALWGQAGDANVSFFPFLDVGQLGDRQKLFRLLDEYYSLVIDLGGSISAEEGDGRLRAPYIEKMYDADIYQLFGKIKQIFDPYNIMNPGVKLGSSIEDNKAILRNSYSLAGKHNYLPRS